MDDPSNVPRRFAATSCSGAAPREPHLLRFGLRHALLCVAGFSAILALLVTTGGAWPWVIGVSATLVAAHVFGTLVGTRLRDTSEQVQQWRSAASGRADAPVRTIQPLAQVRSTLPAATMLAESHRAPQRDVWAVAVGSAAGFVAGAVAILLLVDQRTSWSGVVLGAVSCAVIGGWFALLATSFGAIARNAWRHANASDDKPRTATDESREP